VENRVDLALNRIAGSQRGPSPKRKHTTYLSCRHMRSSTLARRKYRVFAVISASFAILVNLARSLHW
jgi:hypothetical protein